MLAIQKHVSQHPRLDRWKAVAFSRRLCMRTRPAMRQIFAKIYHFGCGIASLDDPLGGQTVRKNTPHRRHEPPRASTTYAWNTSPNGCACTPRKRNKTTQNALENPVSKSRDYGTPARISRSSSCDVWLPRRRSPIASRVPNTSRRRNLKKLAWCNLATGIGANERQTHAGQRLRRLITGGDMTSHGGD